jgi:hypothetical protein
MYEIRIRGEHDPIMVSDERGAQLAADYAAGTLPDIIQIDGSMFNSKGIMSVKRIGIDWKRPEFSSNDLTLLRSKLAKFAQHPNDQGRLVSRREQYLVEARAIRVNEDDQWVVIDPQNFARIEQMFSELDKLNRRDAEIDAQSQNTTVKDQSVALMKKFKPDWLAHPEE